MRRDICYFFKFEGEIEGNSAKVVICFEMAPTGLRFRCGLAHDPRYMRSVLSKLMTMPEALQKVWTTSRETSISCWLWIKKHVSSAYCFIFVGWGASYAVMPVRSELSTNILSPCTTMANSKGNRLSPCLPPPGSVNPGDNLPLIMHWALVSVNANDVHRMNPSY